MQSFNTALTIAIKKGSFESAKLLVDKKADVNAKNAEVIIVVHIVG